MEPIYFSVEKDKRTLADAGGAKTITEAKKWLVENWRTLFENFEVTNRTDLTTLGVAKMNKLVKLGYARPLFLGGAWVVTDEPWAAEFIIQQGND